MGSFFQKIFSSRGDFPVKISFKRGRFGSDFILRHHPEAEIQFIKKGLGAYYVGNRRYPFARNALLFIKPNAMHRYMHWTGQYVEKITLVFAPRFLSKGRVLPLKLPVCFCPSDKEAAEFESLMNAISEEMELKKEYWQEVVINKIKLLLILLKRIRKKQTGNLPERNPLIDKVQEYLDQHFNQELSVAMLARLFYISPSHLAHLFKKYTTTGIKQYILWRRILEAKAILSNDPSVKAVRLSQLVGFSDYALFHRCFKRCTGSTLSTYRRLRHN
ncbi:MAG: helix-turn-helix transcriptional regulator [Lentisphaerae bacterium]|nr:helix-turn-helix transcriptional regulator [Lentisphaerota bacterium]